MNTPTGPEWLSIEVTCGTAQFTGYRRIIPGYENEAQELSNKYKSLFAPQGFTVFLGNYSEKPTVTVADLLREIAITGKLSNDPLTRELWAVQSLDLEKIQALASCAGFFSSCEPSMRDLGKRDLLALLDRAGAVGSWDVDIIMKGIIGLNYTATHDELELSRLISDVRAFNEKYFVCEEGGSWERRMNRIRSVSFGFC